MRTLSLLALAVASVAVLPAFAEVDPKIHKLCIEAKDYSGCVKAQGAIKGSDTASSGVAEARSKEMSDKLYDFNKRQFIVQNPSLAGWIKSNPKLARESIEKEFLFFKKKDYQDPDGLMSLCRRRGAMSIDYNFNWSKPCSVVNKANSVKANNKWLKDAVNLEIKREFRFVSAKENCANKGKQIRKDSNGKTMCMSDFEYASYTEQLRSRRAQEVYRERMRRQAEIDRKNASWKALGDYMKSVGEQLKGPKTINCTTTYGSYSSNTNCY